MLGLSQSRGPKLFGREIIFEEFQLMCCWYLNVTDRQTDRQTDGRTDRRLAVALPRSALASRGKKKHHCTPYSLGISSDYSSPSIVEWIYIWMKDRIDFSNWKTSGPMPAMIPPTDGVDFWYDVTLSRWWPRRLPATCCCMQHLLVAGSPSSACKSLASCTRYS